jgi:hypothetical protein
MKTDKSESKADNISAWIKGTLPLRLNMIYKR